MLVLSRKESESIEITSSTGEVITVAINSIKGNRVSLAIEAPKSVKVIRGELKNKEPKRCVESANQSPSTATVPLGISSIG